MYFYSWNTACQQVDLILPSNRGHLRPALAFSLNLVSLFPELSVTFIVSHARFAGAQSEILRFFGTNTTPTAGRFRLIPLGKKDADPRDPATQLITMMAELPATFTRLLDAKVDGEGFDRRPTLAMADVSLSRRFL